MVTTRTKNDVLRFFDTHRLALYASIPEDDPNAKAMVKALRTLEKAVERHGGVQPAPRVSTVNILLKIVLLCVVSLVLQHAALRVEGDLLRGICVGTVAGGMATFAAAALFSARPLTG